MKFIKHETPHLALILSGHKKYEGECRTTGLTMT